MNSTPNPFTNLRTLALALVAASTGWTAASSLAATIPFSENFSAATLTELSSEWSLETTETGEIAVVDDPGQSGNRFLQFGQSGYGSESAVLNLDLSGRTNITLDFRVQQAARYNALGSAEVSISQDGTNWFRVVTLGWLPNEVWRRVSVAIDPVMQAHGLSYGTGFQIKFFYGAGRYSRGNVWWWDDVRVTMGEDVFGPAVTGLFPGAPWAGPLASCRLTFNEPIAPASLGASAVTVLDPAGNPVALNSVVPDEDRRGCTVHFAIPQTLPGVYRMALDGHVSDLAGNWLDQSADGISDPFSGTFRMASTMAGFPLLENFHGGLTNPGAGWRFETTDQAMISIVGDPVAPANPVLRFSQAGYGSEGAILTLDLAGRTNVTLDFRVQQAAPYYVALGSAEVSISPDGTNWQAVKVLYSTPVGVWRQVTVELDPVVQARGWSYGSGFQIRFYYSAGYYGRGAVWLWDDVLVSSLGIAQRTLNIRRAAGAVELGFNPDPAFDYTVQYRDAMNGSAPWLSLPGLPHNSGSLIDSAAPVTRFYRMKIDLRPTASTAGR